jgi:hypothetical protein
MRRAVIKLGIVAILVSSCGRNDPPASFETRLRERVASIRDLAEEGKPGLARDRLENLVASVTSRLDRGLIDEGWALEILESAQVVDVQLRLLPAPSESEAPSPSPIQEEEGDGKGKDEKDKDKGNGDEDHGNDD